MLDECRGCCLAAVVIPLLCCGLMVCGVIYILASAPEPPISENFQASQADAQAFDYAITSVQNQAGFQNQFILTFTEKQISSWMTLEGQDFADERGYSFPFEDIQVGLEDGQMTFYANFTNAGIELPLEIIIEPKIDERGHLQMEIDSAHVGGITLPGIVLDSITDQVETSITRAFDDLDRDYVLYEPTLAVDNGTFAVQGSLQ
ncbi:MAG: hypothetical protein JXJ20_01935 [Anaerolineae bacterium]|jgi:uncharacterized protein YpmS|nr:hypothetical protein [Anaerolineae bacterium]